VIVIPYNKLGIKDSIVLSIILTVSIAVLENISAILVDDPKVSIDHYENTTTPTAQSTAPSTQTIPPIKTINTTISTDTTSKTNTSTNVKETPVKTPTESSEIYQGQPNAEDKKAIGSRTDDGVIKSDMPYTDYNHIPLGDEYKPSDFEYGYSFLPPEKWYPTPPFPPVCVCEKRCPTYPTYTTGTPVDVKEWQSSSKIMPPDGINTKFIEERLNSGR
jgi:hypothetical protein